MLYHISYVSRSIEKMSSQELKTLEAQSASKNKQNAVTGFLVYDGFHFFQYIEGEKQVIEDLFARIEQDQRHDNVTLTSEGSMSSRLLPQWSMRSFMPSDFVSEDRVHILDILSQKHEKESIPEIVQGLQFRDQPA